MIHAIGIDIVEVKCIDNIIERWGDSFVKRIYSQEEIDYCYRKVRASMHFAARFAAKEAVMKALGTGNIGISWQDIEILTDEDGAPSVYLSGGAESRARELGVKDFAISLSHSREYAVASVVGGL